MSHIVTPFKSLHHSPPSPHAKSNSGAGGECVATPKDDTSVLSTIHYVDLPHSKAALAIPMGTAIPGIGHAVKG